MTIWDKAKSYGEMPYKDTKNDVKAIKLLPSLFVTECRGKRHNQNCHTHMRKISDLRSLFSREKEDVYSIGLGPG
jgi:hypothetical protein